MKKQVLIDPNALERNMTTIKENIAFILEYQKKMGYHMPSIVNRPATDKEINEVEKELGIVFNNELKELFKTMNGIHLDYKTDSGLTGIIPIYDLLSLNGAVSYYGYMEWDIHWENYLDTYENQEEIGRKLFPILEDGAGNCYWVDLNEGTENYGRLYWTNTYGEEDSYHFSSLTVLFEAIKRGYEDGIFTLDEKGYLGCNYDGWWKICGDLNKSVKYWNE